MPPLKPLAGSPGPREAVTNYFHALAHLSDGESEMLRRVLSRLSSHSPMSELVAAGTPADYPLLVVSGWACRTATLPDGRRQIIDFYLPGDPVGYSPLPGARTIAPYVALTRVETATAEELLRCAKETPETCPGLAEAWRRIEEQIEIRVLHQLIRNGRQTAYERVAHLLLEFHDRLNMCGLVTDHRYVLPLTQEVLADAVGLSTVHMNRTMQQLRREGLIKTSEGCITVLDETRLAAVAGRQSRNGDSRRMGAWQARAALAP
jgi:CRP-like cAMP-binding protein